MKKSFTLIELIVVIAIISILTAIILPNVSSLKEKSLETAVVSNQRNLQAVSDMYQLENNSLLPTLNVPTILLPQPIDFAKIYPEHLRNLPKTEGVKYWIDVTGTVWVSYSDMPLGVVYNEITNTLSWNADLTAIGYQIFEIKQQRTVGSALNTKIKYQEVIKLNDPSITSFVGEENKAYAISAIDKYGFASAPIATSEGYEDGYTDTLESIKKGQTGEQGGSNGEEQSEKETYEVIVSPTIIDENTTIDVTIVNKDNQTEVQGEVEYKLDGGTTTTTPPTGPLNEGSHELEVRVKDENGDWSEWIKVPIVVTKGTENTIQAVITVTPNTNITVDTTLTWSYANSTDLTGKSIVGAEWKVDGTIVLTPPTKLTAGTHTVELRVKNSENEFSPWISKTIEVTNVAPTTATLTSLTATYNSVRLNFNTVGATIVEIYRNNVKVGEVSGTVKTFNDTGLSVLTNYSYYILAINDAGAKKSSTSSIRTWDNIPAPTIAYVTESVVSNKFPDNGYNASGAPVIWVSFYAKDATSAVIYRDENQVGSYSNLTNGVFTYKDANTSWGAGYNYKVVFTNNGGETTLTHYQSISSRYPSDLVAGAAPTLTLTASITKTTANATITASGAIKQTGNYSVFGGIPNQSGSWDNGTGGTISSTHTLPSGSVTYAYARAYSGTGSRMVQKHFIVP